jgi:hypothetical protein
MDVFRNFCRVFQILPKHLKIYQYKSYAESPGTHLIFRVALLVLSGKGVNLLRKLRITIHPRHKNLQVGIWISLSIWIQFTFGVGHILEGRSIYNFHIYQLWNLHVNFWELCKQTRGTSLGLDREPALARRRALRRDATRLRRAAALRRRTTAGTRSLSVSTVCVSTARTSRSCLNRRARAPRGMCALAAAPLICPPWRS